LPSRIWSIPSRIYAYAQMDWRSMLMIGADMKKLILATVVLLGTTGIMGGVAVSALAGAYDPSPTHPFGQVNPAAPAELSQFAFAIGRWSCEVSNKGPDDTWTTAPLAWRFHYTLNGMAIEDQFDGELRYQDFRQFDVSTNTWKHTFMGMNYGVEQYHYEGTFENGEMRLQNEVAVNQAGQEQFFRFVFHTIADDSFQWRGLVFTDGVENNNSNISCQRSE